ncbi:MAG TPA: cell division protein ZapB [Vicinamibacterales bacterium]
MAKQAVARAIDLDPIDRLEEKIKLLVSVVTGLRADQAKAADENGRLMQEIDALRSRLADAQGASVELDALREEREAVRQRVAEMLSHLEAI